MVTPAPTAPFKAAMTLSRAESSIAAPPTLILSPWKTASTFAPLIASSAARNAPSHGAVVAVLSTPMSLFTLSAPNTALSASVIDVFASWSGTTPDVRTTPLSLLSANRVGVAAGKGAVDSAVATAAGAGVAGACSVVAGAALSAGAGGAGGVAAACMACVLAGGAGAGGGGAVSCAFIAGAAAGGGEAVASAVGAGAGGGGGGFGACAIGVGAGGGVGARGPPPGGGGGPPPARGG